MVITVSNPSKIRVKSAGLGGDQFVSVEVQGHDACDFIAIYIPGENLESVRQARELAAQLLAVSAEVEANYYASKPGELISDKEIPF